MAVNKVVYGQKTIVDLTEDTVSESTLLSGYTAHNKAGDKVVGAVAFVNVFTGTEEPPSTLGEDGDIYLMI